MRLPPSLSSSLATEAPPEAATDIFYFNRSQADWSYCMISMSFRGESNDFQSKSTFSAFGFHTGNGIEVNVSEVSSVNRCFNATMHQDR
jgi:hypothetical protein